MIKESDYKQCKCGRFYLNDGTLSTCDICEQETIEEHEKWTEYKGKNHMDLDEEDLSKYVEGELDIIGTYESKGKKYFVIRV